jgi:catechol 2,3-dioxygenase-like lactoylglutathione lyase family enzyme
MRTKVERINPSLDVQDFPASMRYYVEVLGFELYVETPTMVVEDLDGNLLVIGSGPLGGVPFQD